MEQLQSSSLVRVDSQVVSVEVKVFLLAGEMLSVAEVFLEQQMHPTVIISAYRQALDDIVKITKEKIR